MQLLIRQSLVWFNQYNKNKRKSVFALIEGNIFLSATHLWSEGTPLPCKRLSELSSADCIIWE